MRKSRGLVPALFAFSLSFLYIAGLAVGLVSSQVTSDVALQRGYRTGYSDGYMAGYRDAIDNKSREFSNHDDYLKADRAYNRDYGSIDDYRDGYRQGFEAGYTAGYEKKAFDVKLPQNLVRRGDVSPARETLKTGDSWETSSSTRQDSTKPSEAENNASPQLSSAVSGAGLPADGGNRRPAGIQKITYVSTEDPIIIVPRDTEIIIELDEALDTERNREGDRFTARVVSPVEIAGATIEGHIEKVTRPGRIKRRSELLLSFDRIVLSERRWSNFSAIVTEVLPVRGDNVKTVDDEGTAVGRGTLKNDSIKIGAATGTGATIGAVTAGPVGAAIGAGVGAAFGVSSVVIERGKHIQLSKSQQLRIKSSYETQIR